MKKWIAGLSSLFFAGLVGLAQDIPVESWRTHFSYNDVRVLAVGNQKVFCGAQNGIFYVDTTTGQIGILSKLDGLSDVGTTSMAYNEEHGTLVIGYASGLIDLLSNGKVRTIDGLKNSTLVGSKAINDVHTAGDLAFVGTGFGVIVISLVTREIIDNYGSIGPGGADADVQELMVDGNQLWAITNHGIQSGDLNTNLLDFNNWTLYPDESNSYQHLARHGGKLYTVKNDTSLTTLVDGAWELVNSENDEPIHGLLGVPEGLYLLKSDKIDQWTGAALVTIAQLNGQYQANAITYLNGLWIADERLGLIDPALNSWLPNGPLSDDISNIRFTDQRLFAFYGPGPDFYAGEVDSLGYSVFDNTSWEAATIDGFYNLTDVARFNDQLYFSSIGFGVYNSTSGDTLPGMGSSKKGYGPLVPSLTISDQLYIPAFDHRQPVFSLSKEGTLTPHDSAFVGTSFPLSITFSNGRVAWVQRSNIDGGGFQVFDFEGTDFRTLDGADKLPSSNIRGLAISLDDEAWVATARGPAIFQDATFIFDNSEAVLPIFESSGLFEDENVSAIAIDGGNRIWMSTKSGLWIFDNSLSVLEARFTTDNSPIPSNTVLEMAYNPRTGEMYMLTDRGLVSYRSSSSIGGVANAQVNIFPNPVRPGYSGKVGISGLVKDANVKITDVNGKLMREIKANGGTASWDLQDYNGKHVGTGVYVLFATDVQGLESYIGKLAVIN